MSWLDTLLARGDEARSLQPPVPAALKRSALVVRKPPLEIQSVWITTVAPKPPDDPGAVEQAFYFVSDGVLTLCDEAGRSAGKSFTLGPNDDARCVAGRLKLEAWRKEQGSGFNRPLHYPQVSYA